MADLENASRGNQLVGPKGDVLSGYVNPTDYNEGNPDEQPELATIKRVEPRGKTAKNAIKVH